MIRFRAQQRPVDSRRSPGRFFLLLLVLSACAKPSDAEPDPQGDGGAKDTVDDPDNGTTEAGGTTEADSTTDDDDQNTTDDDGTMEAECEAGTHQLTSCGANGRGTAKQTCKNGRWSDAGACSDPDDCRDDSSRSGLSSCGLNGRGGLRQQCLLGHWRDIAECEDVDHCVDHVSRNSLESCGLNGRGYLQEACVSGQWQTSGECLDADLCIDASTALGLSACGKNGAGLLQAACIDGNWQDTSMCLDPDVCRDGSLEPGSTPCGLNDRGKLKQECFDGNWRDAVTCDDPDQCVDNATRNGDSVCGAGYRGTLDQRCTAGTWENTDHCVERPYNILLVISDDVGAESLTLYPSAVGSLGAAHMPNIDELAAAGIVFDNVWANPVCSPTRAAMLTGLYGNRTNVLTPGNRLDPGVVSVYDAISSRTDVDYDIAVFGKWHLAGTSLNDNQLVDVKHVLDLGVETYQGFIGGFVDDYFSWPLVNSDGTETISAEYSTTTITNLALDYINARAAQSPERPWFVHLAYNAPHSPFQVPPAALHDVDLGALAPGEESESVLVYQAMLEAMDKELGRVLSAVDLSETIVIYVGDNGTPVEVKDATSPVRGSKITTYEGGIWVPMVIAGAGVTRNNEREESLVVASDLYATIISLAGIPVDHINDSYSLVPLLYDGDATTGREYSFSEHCSPLFGNHIAVRDQRFKLLRSYGVWQMFDLQNDRGENTNLFADPNYAEVRATLEAQLAVIKQNAAWGCL